MNTTVRQIIIKGILLFTFFSHNMGIQASSSNIQVELNQNLERGIAPIIEQDTTLVPLKSISTLLGASVHWDAPTKTIIIVQGDVTNTLTVNETTAYKEDANGKTQILLALPPMFKNEITYVPLRYIAESLDIKVDWDQQTNTIKMNESLEYKNKNIFLGDDSHEVIDLLGKPSFTMTDEIYEYLFYVHDYKNVLILYSSNDIVVGFTTNAETMKFRNITYGSQKEGSINNLTLLKDTHDGNKVVGMGYNINNISTVAETTILANERIIFELTNAFRAHNNIEAFKYNSKLSNVAREHSKDMAAKNYFSHTSLDGTSMKERITRSGIDYLSSCGENIAAGNQAGLSVFGQWLNSLGHRTNMLEQSGDLGVGSAYRKNSTYGYYHTQNFAKHGRDNISLVGFIGEY